MTNRNDSLCGCKSDNIAPETQAKNGFATNDTKDELASTQCGGDVRIDDGSFASLERELRVLGARCSLLDDGRAVIINRKALGEVLRRASAVKCRKCNEEGKRKGNNSEAEACKSQWWRQRRHSSMKELDFNETRLRNKWFPSFASLADSQRLNFNRILFPFPLSPLGPASTRFRCDASRQFILSAARRPFSFFAFPALAPTLYRLLISVLFLRTFELLHHLTWMHDLAFSFHLSFTFISPLLLRSPVLFFSERAHVMEQSLCLLWLLGLQPECAPLTDSTIYKHIEVFARDERAHNQHEQKRI